MGIRAHDLGRFSPDELARRVSAEGLDCFQLALGKAIEGLEMAPGVIHSAMAGAIGAAFARYGVRIEVLGCLLGLLSDCAPGPALILEETRPEHLTVSADFIRGMNPLTIS